MRRHQSGWAGGVFVGRRSNIKGTSTHPPTGASVRPSAYQPPTNKPNQTTAPTNQRQWHLEPETKWTDVQTRFVRRIFETGTRINSAVKYCVLTFAPVRSYVRACICTTLVSCLRLRPWTNRNYVSHVKCTQRELNLLSLVLL